MSSFTPGPWEVCRERPYEIVNSGACLVATVDTATDTQEQWEADARLIAAAPDMLAALVKIIEMNVQYAIDRYGDAAHAEAMSCVQIARAAIARAEGKAS